MEQGSDTGQGGCGPSQEKQSAGGKHVPAPTRPPLRGLQRAKSRRGNAPKTEKSQSLQPAHQGRDAPKTMTALKWRWRRKEPFHQESTKGQQPLLSTSRPAWSSPSEPRSRARGGAEGQRRLPADLAPAAGVELGSEGPR